MSFKTLAAVAAIGVVFGFGANAAEPGHGKGAMGDGIKAMGPGKASMGRGSHWGYSGKQGPAFWGSLSAANRRCSHGRAQSPMNLSGGERAQLGAIKMRYRLTPLNIVHNGHTVQVNYGSGSSIEIAGKRFHLAQFHFHTRSEHTVDGRSFPMEIHLVHKSDAGELAVIGLLVQQGDENLALREIWNHLPALPGPAKSAKRVLINARDLLPSRLGYFRYMGSLTTPPCSEGVNWFVMVEPIEASAAQIRTISQIMGKNARPVQPRNSRLLLDGSASQ